MDGTQVGNYFGGASLIVSLLAIVILILWILLPFAVFGLKGRVDQLIKEQKDTNELLSRLVSIIQSKQENDSGAEQQLNN